MSDGNNNTQKARPSAATARKKTRRSSMMFFLFALLGGIHVLQLTGLDAAIPKIIGTVGYWFGLDWETSVRASLGTALFVLFVVGTAGGMYLSKQEEA